MKAFSLLVMAVIVGLNLWFGVFDLDAITTGKIADEYQQFVGRTINISAFTVTEWGTKEVEDGILVGARIVNGRISVAEHPRPPNSIFVIGKFEKNSEFQKELLAGRKLFLRVPIRITKDSLLFAESPTDSNSLSWFRTPYEVVLMVSNRFIDLQSSIIFAAVCQVIVLSIIAILVSQGAFILLPALALHLSV